MNTLKKRVFDIIQIGNREDGPSFAFDLFIMVVILTNITVIFLETFDEMAPYRDVLQILDTLTIGIFIIEYGLRIWTAEYLYPGLSRRKAVMRFFLSYDGIVDLLTILPFFFLSGFVVFRMLRVVRILRLFRINSTYDSFNVIKSVIYEKKNQLASSLFILIVLMLASSLCMYSAEHEAQPEIFRNALSGIWWSMSTLLTVGYGDIYPVTELGRAMAIVISVLGVMAVAIPTGILSAGFVENYTEAAYSSAPLNFRLQTVQADADSGWINRSAKEVLEDHGYRIILVKRNGVTFPPKDNYRVFRGDELAVYKDSSDEDGVSA
jgi:voltage-gated potassium channel